MLRIPGFWVALAVALFASAPARAASLFFQGGSTSETSICAAPCYRVWMFIEDPTRSLEIRAIQMDLDVLNASPATLPVPPGRNSNATGGNANLEDAAGDIWTVPWDLRSDIGASPQSGLDVRIWEEGSEPVNVDEMAAKVRANPGCLASVNNCSMWGVAVRSDRLLLGNFNLTGVIPGGSVPVGIRAEGLSGEGPLALDLARLNGGSCTFDASGGCAIPEPAGVLLLGTALLHVALQRRRALG